MQYDKFAISGPCRILGRLAPGFEARRRQSGNGSPSTPPRQRLRTREADNTRSLARPCLGSCLGREQGRVGGSFPLALRACDREAVTLRSLHPPRARAPPRPRFRKGHFFLRLSLLLQILFTNLAHSLPLTERHSASRSVSCTCLLGCLLTTHLLLKAGSLCTPGRVLTDSSATCVVLFYSCVQSGSSSQDSGHLQVSPLTLHILTLTNITFSGNDAPNSTTNGTSKGSDMPSNKITGF